VKGELVYIESPFAASEDFTVEDHVEYAKLCLKDSLERGEYPFVSHLLYPLVLDDLAPPERRQGMKSGEAWAQYADLRAVYVDKGQSRGMDWGIARAEKAGQKIEYRTIEEGNQV
jgi:hypothetical protein